MRRRILLAAATTALVAAACVSTDNPVAPPSAPLAPSVANQSLLGLGGATTVTPLHRTKALSQSLSASANIGPLGGTLAVPGAGILVVIPPLAVPKTKTITVTATAGSNVAYEFAPHGLKFNLPLIVTQNLSGTDASQTGSIDPLSLFAGYYPDSTNVTSITEQLNVNVNLLDQLATFTVWHFSGYILASGRQ